MYSIHSENDLHKLDQLRQKQNIIVRFVMNGCGWCEQTQPMWNDATRHKLSPNDAFAEVESNFLEQFKQSMSPRKDFNVRGFPTIMIIRGKNVYEHQGRDTNSIIKAIKQIKRKSRKTKKR